MRNEQWIFYENFSVFGQIENLWMDKITYKSFTSIQPRVWIRGYYVCKNAEMNLKFTTPNAYQALPIVRVAFLDDNSAFVSHILLCFDKRRSTFNRVWSVNFRCDIFSLSSGLVGQNFRRHTKRSNTAVWPERSHIELSFIHSWSLHKITTLVIVARNFKFGIWNLGGYAWPGLIVVTGHDWPVKKAIVNLPIMLKGNSHFC